MKMKVLLKSFLALAVSTIVQSGCAGEPSKLHITGNVTGCGDSVKVVVLDAQTYSLSAEQTVAVANNKFECTVEVKEVSPAMILNLKDGKPMGRMSICAVPGEECQITGDWGSEYFLNGSSFYKNFNEMDRALTPVTSEKTQFINECQQMLSNGVKQDSVMAIYESKIGEIDKKVANAQMAYIKANPSNEACATLLEEMDVEQVHEAYNSLSEEVRNGRMSAILTRTLARADKELKRREQAKNIAEGKAAPEISLNDINGKPLTLSSLKGKYVVLDFWGSWCGWCIKGFPEMKNYYNKYKGKFEILGIDCNDTEVKWKEAVKKHELPWLHVYCPKTSDVTTRYAIQGFPTKIVVDPKGNIAKVVVGEDPAFYTYLDSLFQ